MKQYRIKVRGRGVFPVDMLRYDQCFPATETDSAIINESGARIVELIRYSGHQLYRPVTTARWDSFGWTAMNVEELQ